MQHIDLQFKIASSQDRASLPLLNYYLGFLPLNTAERLKKRFRFTRGNLEFATWIKPSQIASCVRQAGDRGFSVWVSADKHSVFFYGVALIANRRKRTKVLNWLRSLARPGDYGHVLLKDETGNMQLLKIKSPGHCVFAELNLFSSAR